MFLSYGGSKQGISNKKIAGKSPNIWKSETSLNNLLTKELFQKKFKQHSKLD